MGHADRDATNLSDFERAVKRVVAAIPRGTVLAYGEVAVLAGRPGGARAVVKALHRLSGLPWWRVVRADRTMAPEIVNEQAPKLKAEGVTVVGRRIVALGKARATSSRPVAKASRPASKPGPSAPKKRSSPRKPSAESFSPSRSRAGGARRRRPSTSSG